MITPTYLKYKNSHPRDGNIQFFEDGHRYLVNGKGGFTSTTTYIHSLFSQFDTEGIISAIVKKKEWANDPDYKYYRMSADDIAESWKKNGETASRAGTKMHYMIECYFNTWQYEKDLERGDSFALSLIDPVDDEVNDNGGDSGGDGGGNEGGDGGGNGGDGGGEGDGEGDGGEEEDDCVVLVPPEDDGSPESQYFHRFLHEIVIKERFEPYRTEMLVYDEDVRITGSIDMLFRMENGEYAIFDWKRSKEIQYHGFRGKKSHVTCIRHLDDSNFWHYSLQLNIYRRILQKNYGFIVSDLRLVILHPNNDDYMCIRVPFLDSEIDALFEMRENEIKRNLITDIHTDSHHDTDHVT